MVVDLRHDGIDLVVDVNSTRNPNAEARRFADEARPK